MRTYFIILLGLLLTTSSTAQNCTLHGRVTDAQTSEGLIGVAIFLDSAVVGVTDVSGNYSIKTFSGKHFLKIKLMSFEDYAKEVDLIENEKRVIDVQLKSTSKLLNTVVISAGRFEQKLEEVTVSMEVLKPAIIEAKNTTTMEDAIEQIPGVNVVDGQANIRGGSGWSYGTGSRVQILVDDLPQLTADANDAKWNFIPVENLEQVEVVKGASSVLFGSSALNGVINIRTAYPKSEPETKFSFFTGIYDKPVFKIDGHEYNLKWWGNNVLTTSGFSFFHSQKINQLDLVVGENVFNDQGYRQGESERRGRFNVNARYRFKKIDGLSAGVNFNTMTSLGTLFFFFKNDTTGAYTPADNTLSNYRSTRTNVDPFVTYVNKKLGTFKLRTRWFNTVNHNNTSQGSSADLYYYELQYQKSIKENLNMTAGLLDVVSVVRSELYGNHDGSQKAAYVQGDLKAGKFTFSAGARIEKNSVDTVSDNLIPVFRSGINFHAFKGTFVRASIGQGYRFPSIAEKFVKTNVGNIVIYPNTDLRSEKGLSYEIGIRQLIKIKKWNGYLDAAVFRNEYKNMMEFSFAQWGKFTDPFIGNGFKSLNIGDTRIEGIDISLGVNTTLGKDWNFSLVGGITSINGQQLNYDSAYVVKVGGLASVMGSDSTNFLKYRSKNMFKADLNIQRKKFEVGLSVRYSSRMENIDKIFVSGLLDLAFPPGLAIGHYRKYHRQGDYIYDFRSSWAVSKHVKLSFIIKNMLNYIYMQRPADMQPPRQWVGQVNFSF